MAEKTFKEIRINWKDINVLNIKNKNGVYYSEINTNGLEEAKKDGFLVGIIWKTNIISKKLPGFIRERVPNTERDPIEYFRKTKGELVTDNLSVNIID